MQPNKQTQPVKPVHCLIATLGLAALVGAWNVSVSRGQEHPEHPGRKAKAESAVTLEDVAKRIESYVKQQSRSGTFKVLDKQAGKQLSLTLDQVHRDRLSQVGPNMFFACADFKSADGKVYDLDFFVQGARKDRLRVLSDRTSIHKENGKERYTWAFDDEKKLWVQKPVEPK
jgi:hypothetical protein